MNRSLLAHGLLAGAIVGIPTFTATVALAGHPTGHWGVAFGYLTMLLALSVVFVAIKRRRDAAPGGVIGFWRAFGMGLAISAIAGVAYALAWEAALAATHLDFAGEYARVTLEKLRAAGASAGEMAQASARMEAFKRQYAQPAIRMAMTFGELFPVGLLVSLVSAALLRNPRFLPLRGTVA